MTTLSVGLLLAGCLGTQPLTAPAPVDPDLHLEDANNYTWAASLTVASTDVVAGADFTIDWSALTVDLKGRAFDGAVTELSMARLASSPGDLEVKLVSDQSVAQEFSGAGWLARPVGDRSLLATRFATMGGTPFEPEDLVEDGDQWVAMLYDTDETRTQFDLRGIHYITALASSTNTQIDLVDGGSTLTSTPDLHTMPPLQATAGAAPGRLHWSGLTVDAHGEPIDLDYAHELIVARVDVATPQDAEPLLVALDEHAAELYRFNLGKDVDPSSSPTLTEASLDAAVDDLGATFAGFTTAGVWLVGLRCNHCIAPMAMAVVEVH